MNFLKTPPLFKHLFPSLVWDLRSAQVKSIYLTFDDGPVPEVTPFILDALASYQAKATFFCVGENVERHPTIFRQVVEAGHRVGNHTHHHLNGWKTSTATYLEDVSRCEATLAQRHHDSLPDRLFRPPYGRISIRQLRKLQQQYRIIMWDILSGDFDKNFPAKDCLKKSISHSTSGTIIIFHDSYKAVANLAYVLPRYLDHFASSGYEFSTI
jgi:peptidoglycan-N-acetylglucosamine deacetylase